MAHYSDDKGQSIVEMSLTELAFIFFFILLVFTVWKISSANETIKQNELNIQVLEQKNKDLQSALTELSRFLDSSNIENVDEFFMELALAKKQAHKVKALEKSNQHLQEQLNDLNQQMSKIANVSNQSTDEIIADLQNYQRILERLKKTPSGEKNKERSAEEKLSNLLQNSKDLTGQNEYLRKQVLTLGKGLDHPPCWTNEKGNTEFLYNVYIHEDHLEFKKGWPTSREKQAQTNKNLTNVLGVYPNNEALWKASAPLYHESTRANCRHVVRVYDLAVSKKSYKYFLSGIENHFYKSLRKSK